MDLVLEQAAKVLQQTAKEWLVCKDRACASCKLTKDKQASTGAMVCSWCETWRNDCEARFLLRQRNPRAWLELIDKKRKSSKELRATMNAMRAAK